MTLILNGTDNSATTPAVTGTDTDTGVFFPAANVLAFATNGTEDARFDSGGNLLIGQSVDNFPGAGNTILGVGINASGRVAFSAAAAPVAYFNRNTDNGEILSFRRQGNGVGAIDITTTGITLSGANGIRFTGNQVASADANTLDDYEEGTWTPVLSGSGGGAASGLTASGVYTKTGNMVIATAFISYAKNTLAGYANFEGLPFAAASGYYPQGTLLMDQMTAQTYNPLVQLGSSATVAIPITGNYGTGTHDQLQWSAKNSSQGTIRFTLCYSAN